MKDLIIGAIAGDIIGSNYEFDNVKTLDFELFPEGCNYTDDSILTIATMDKLITSNGYTQSYRVFGHKYPHPKGAYGNSFERWLNSDNPQPYNSFGNGAAMRASPIGWYCGSIIEVMKEAKESASVTHNHTEGIKGAQATALSVYLARIGYDKDTIKKHISKTFNYDLDRKIDDIRPNYQFDESCQGTVPEAIIAFLESNDFEHAIRLAVSLGGDSDTLACITGGIAEAYYKWVPNNIYDRVLSILPKHLLEIVKMFSTK